MLCSIQNLFCWCPTFSLVQMDLLSQLFERQYLWNEAINHIVVLSPNNAMGRCTEKVGKLSF